MGDECEVLYLRAIAVHRSGAATGEACTIWLVEAAEGQIIRLENGRDRATIADRLIHEATPMPALVVGLDFAFSLPDWAS